MPTKLSYSEIDAPKKHKVRDFLFSFFSQKNIVGLAGPNINLYLKKLKEKGFTKAEIWENNPEVLIKQLTEMKPDIPITYNFGNIFNAISGREDTLYDFDFCCTIKSSFDLVDKFKNESNFIMTFAVRNAGVDFTIERFFKIRHETIVENNFYKKPIEHRIIKTQNGEYIIVRYRDTSDMICIAKIK